jgi:acetyl esterase/lipase
MKRTILYALAFLLWGQATLFADDDKRSVGDKAFLETWGRDCPVVPLWPKGFGPNETKPDLVEGFSKLPDGYIAIRPVVKPSLIIMAPPKEIPSTGVTIVFCPGGGYGSLGTGTVVQCARWLNAMGGTAVLLKYRVPRRAGNTPTHKLPLQDAQRAVGLLRSRAKEWGLDPNKIGIAGFSAGGHLAAMLSNHHATRLYEPVDDHDRVSCRPDFALLLYPAYLTKPILELTPDPELQQERMTPERTPPTLIAITRPDKFTIGCTSYMAALIKARVPAELHVYASGGHGGAFDKYPFMEWGRETVRFLKDHKFLDAQAVKAGNDWLDKKEPAVKAKQKALTDTAGGPKAAPNAPRGKLGPLADAIAEEHLETGDREIRKLLKSAAPVIPLWPKGNRADDPLKDGADSIATFSGPGSVLRIDRVTRPTLTLMRPEKPDGRAIIICPGGAYQRLAIEHEGIDVGRWLNRQGITVFLLKYRVPKRAGVPVALQDAQRALSLVRSRAGEFGVDPDWIGVAGFSAGGNLAALCCHQYANRSYPTVDAHDKASCRPNFGILVYPAYLANKDGKVVEQLAQPKRNKTPPLFVAFAANDGLIGGAFPYVLALRDAKMPVAFHVYEKGGHGKGIRPDGYPFSQWTEACERWLKDLEP